MKKKIMIKNSYLFPLAKSIFGVAYPAAVCIFRCLRVCVLSRLREVLFVLIGQPQIRVSYFAAARAAAFGQLTQDELAEFLPGIQLHMG